MVEFSDLPDNKAINQKNEIVADDKQNPRKENWDGT